MRAAATALAALALSGCTHDSRTSLDVVLYVSGPSGFTRVHERLACDPPAGNVATPADSCAAIRRAHGLLFRTETGTVCIGGLSFVDVKVDGTYDGKSISRDFNHCGDGRVIAAWARALRVTVLDVTVASGGRVRGVALVCDPPGGDVNEPVRACRSLDRMPSLLRPARPAGCEERSPRVWVSGFRRGGWVALEGGCDFARLWIETLLGFYTPPPERRR